jgi:predicted MPP superfamily phosphohydrolase
MLLRIFLALIFLIAAGLALDGFWLEPSSLRLTRYDVPLDVPQWKGMTIAVISDLHAGAPFIDAAKIDRVVAMTNAARPDLILLTGDYVVTGVLGGHHMSIEEIAAHLAPLHAPLGVYAVLGNHDRWEGGGAHIAAVLTKAGIPDFENAHIVTDTPRGPLTLVNIGDYHSGAAHPPRALKGVPSGTQAICFTHSPDAFPLLYGTACVLTLAGHTHGGQVKLPFLGRPAVDAASIYGQRYAFGLIQETGRTMFVSPGIGTSILPVRFGVPPEISFLTIR